MTCQYCFGKDHNRATCPIRKTVEKSQAKSKGDKSTKL